MGKAYLEQASDDGEDDDGEDGYYNTVREDISLHERDWKGLSECIPAPGIHGGNDGFDHDCGVNRRMEMWGTRIREMNALFGSNKYKRQVVRAGRTASRSRTIVRAQCELVERLPEWHIPTSAKLAAGSVPFPFRVNR